MSDPANNTMATPATTFCVDDTCTHRDIEESVGVVERTFAEVDTHEPDPEKDFPGGIEKDDSIPQSDFIRFLNDGIPPKGTVLVTWETRAAAELVPEAKLILLDRAFIVGDVVKKDATEPMSGTVIGTVTDCDLIPVSVMEEMWEPGRASSEAIQNKYIRCVPTSELCNAHEYREGSIIVYNNWIGLIEEVYDDVTVRLGNGSVVVVEMPSELEAPGNIEVERFNVGDVVTTKKGNLRRGQWKLGAFNPNVPPKGTVVEVRTVSVHVSWLRRKLGAPVQPAIPGSFISDDEPPESLDVDELESGNVFVYDPVKVPSGSQCKYQANDIKITDRVRFRDLAGALVKYDGTKTVDNGLPQGKLEKIPRTATSGYDMNVFFVAQTWTKVRVLWQDLTITETPSTSLIPDPNIDDENEVWPGEIVHTTLSKPGGRTTNGEHGEQVLFEPDKLGVVQSVRPSDRIVSIRWCPDADAVFFNAGEVLGGAVIGKAAEVEEEVSLYDVKSSTSLSRRRGDIVMLHPGALQDGQLPTSSTGLDWVGEVVDLDLEGLLTVRLGLLNPVTDVKIAPEKVILVYSYDMGEDLTAMTSSTDSSVDSDDIMDYAGSEISADSYNERWYEYERADGTRIQVPEDQDEEVDDAWSTEEEEDDNENGDESMPDAPEVDTSTTTPQTPPESETVKSNGGASVEKPESEPASLSAILGSSSDRPESFAILEGEPPADHYYLDHLPSLDNPKLMKRLQKEHKILRNALPDGIFARTWESRLDILRVLIIGPVDTPYEYAPFLIDFHFCSTFPNSPPEAFFHSWTNSTGPVNPNLYEDGKICLSLLGTWHADERNENWNPVKSTVLQLLVSIMGLVLVKKPYYNEAGYEVRAGSAESLLASALYSERTYFRSRGFITHALKEPVEGFKDVIEWLYHSKKEDSPKLLDKAIEAAKAVVQRSSQHDPQEAHDGLRRISKGAVIQLQRQITAMEELRK